MAQRQRIGPSGAYLNEFPSAVGIARVPPGSLPQTIPDASDTPIVFAENPGLSDIENNIFEADLAQSRIRILAPCLATFAAFWGYDPAVPGLQQVQVVVSDPSGAVVAGIPGPTAGPEAAGSQASHSVVFFPVREAGSTAQLITRQEAGAPRDLIFCVFVALQQ